MEQCHTKGREISREPRVIPPLLGERAGVRASVSSNLFFGAGWMKTSNIERRTSSRAPVAAVLKVGSRMFSPRCELGAAFAGVSPATNAGTKPERQAGRLPHYRAVRGEPPFAFSYALGR